MINFIFIASILTLATLITLVYLLIRTSNRFYERDKLVDHVFDSINEQAIIQKTSKSRLDKNPTEADLEKFIASSAKLEVLRKINRKYF